MRTQIIWTWLGLATFVFCGAGVGALAAPVTPTIWRFLAAGFGGFVGLTAYGLCQAAKRGSDER